MASFGFHRAALVLVAAGTLLFPSMSDAQQLVDPWEKEIAGYEAADRVSPPPSGGIVFIGSSTIRHWDTAAAFPDLRIIDRIVTPYQPRIVVVYAGDNDISSGKTSEQVVVDAERFVNRVRAKVPGARIIFIGVKPSIQRWLQVDRMRLTNAMLRQLAERDDRVAFVDVDGAMMGWDERPRRELFNEDGLHLSPEGYRLWTLLLRPLLAP